MSRLHAFVPRLTLDLLAAAAGTDSGPRSRTVDAAVLLADVSGFTQLVDALAHRHGSEGAEHLQTILNDCFGPLTAMVGEFGGDVLAFPGDAALALWTCDAGDAPARRECVRRCASCALHIRSRLDSRQIAAGVDLRLRVAVTAGPVRVALVGGLDGRWETVITGAPIEDLATTLHAAALGEVLLAEPAWAGCDGTARGLRRGTNVALESLVPGVNAAVCRQSPSPLADDAIRHLVPAAVRERLEAGHEAWLAEFRAVSVMFIHLASPGDLDVMALHQAVHRVQSLVARFEAEINQVVADDKGLTVVAGFGLPPRAHADDPVRAVMAALALRDELSAGRVQARFGVSTDRVFTGTRGFGSRVEFGMLGPGVVLAARLADAAETVLCDGATRIACRHVIQFGAGDRIALKGKAAPTEVWRPLGIVTNVPVRRSLIGRCVERRMVERRLDDLESRGAGGVVVIQGEPGIGKSAFVRNIVDAVERRGLRYGIGAGDAIEQTNAYRAWRTIVPVVLGLPAAHDSDSAVEALRSHLGDEQRSWFPLLNQVIAVGLPETEASSRLSADSRARTTRELLVDVIKRSAIAGPLVIIVEDAHWVDSASWELIEQAVGSCPDVLFIVSTRTPVDGGPAPRLARTANGEVIALGPLDAADVSAILRQRLAVDAIPDRLAAWVYQRAEGHPLFAEELTLALCDSGALVVREQQCELSAGFAESAAAALPDTIRGVLASRIDRLRAAEQLTLKVASVLGRRFDVADVAAVHPLEQSEARVADMIERVVVSGLVQATSNEPRRFSFSHALVQDVTYELMPFAQRRQLHHRAADLLERQSSADPTDRTPLLAHHWDRAGVAGKAIVYLERAGERALNRDSANPEAEAFLLRLLQLARDRSALPAGAAAAPQVADRACVDQARWTRMLSQAVARQGRHAEAMAHLEESLRLLGHRLPTADVRSQLEATLHVVARVLRGAAGAKLGGASEARRPALLEIARGYDAVVQLLYLGRADTAAAADGRAGKALLSTVALLRATRLAEQCGPCRELSRAYSLVANLFAMIRLPRLARHYADRARAVAEETGDRHSLFRALTMGQLPAFTYGRWDEAAPNVARGLVLGGELRIHHECLISECTLAYIAFHQGALQEAFSRFEDIARRAERYEDLVPQVWAVVGMGEVRYREGHIEEAIALADRGLALANRHGAVDHNSRFQAHGLLASAWLRAEAPEQAFAHVEPAIAAARAGGHLSYSPQSGFVGVAEALLAEWDRSTAGRPRAASRTRRWLRLLRAVAFCRPILEPWDLFFRAAWNHRCSRSSVAAWQLRRAERVAMRYRLPYEAERAALALRAFSRERTRR
jgi:tetratricopeptide (TPR) repeat protein